jgi:ALIX V-shaped domain binding to HIV
MRSCNNSVGIDVPTESAILTISVRRENERVQAMLDLRQCGEMLDNEQAQDDGARDRHGDAWARPPSRVAAASYRENIARYESNLQAAADSDAANAQRLANVQPRLAKLSPEGVRGRMPRLERPMVAPGADADAVVASLRQILSQLEQLSQERGVLEERIRAKREGDNVLPDLLRAGADGAERVFAEHLDAMRAACAGVDGNVARTNEALALLEQYAQAFRKLYDVDGWQEACQRVAGARWLSCVV